MTRQEHLLTCLSEECSEVIKNVSKALRFGLDDQYLHLGTTNRILIYHEVNDILAIVEMLKDEGIVIIKDQSLIDSKIERVESFIKYAKEHGTITE
jgi:oligoribonuclease NrnB/cAMP/cGMP phosphodiesterase (DHH superfamily)